MKLLVSEGGSNHLSSVNPDFATINDVQHPLPIALDASKIVPLHYSFVDFSLEKLKDTINLISNTKISAFDFLDSDDEEAPFNNPFEVIIVGCGEKQRFPDKRFIISSRNMPLEFMTTDAAARTFNILNSEDRKVLALLFKN